MKVFAFICVHVWETNTHARVNLYDMSKYKLCWSWSVSQFSTCLSLLRHGCQRNSFWNSQTDSQMYTFSDQIYWQFVQILMDSKFHSKLCVLDTNDVKQKTSLFSVQGKSAWYILFQGSCYFVLRHLCPVHKINAQTPITTILSTNLLHEFITNVKHRMDWSYRKPYICLSFNFWKQYPADGICLTPVNTQKYVSSRWLLWKSPIFPDLNGNLLTW